MDLLDLVKRFPTRISLRSAFLELRPPPRTSRPKCLAKEGGVGSQASVRGNAESLVPTAVESQSCNWCDKCSAPKPPRAHHCRYCGVCVLLMDHHCIFIDTCVGVHNRRYFFVLVICTCAGSWYTLMTASPFLRYVLPTDPLFYALGIAELLPPSPDGPQLSMLA